MIDIVSFYIGSLVILTIYHIFVFIGRRKDYINLVYAFYCLVLANLLFARMMDNKYDIFLFHIYYIFSVHILIGLLTLFSYYIFKYKKNKSLKNMFFVYIGLSAILIVLFMSFIILQNKIVLKLYFPILSVYGIFFISFVIYIYIIKKGYKEKKITLLIISFFSLVLFLVIFSFLLFFNIRIPVKFLYSIYFINAMFFAIALTAGFNREHKDLIELKNTLEKKVEERTGQIKESHDQKINFFINLVHETKTPLTLLLNYLDNDIKKRGLSYDIKIAKQNADKLKNDMINFLDMEKLYRGQVFYNHEQLIEFSNILKNKVIQLKDIAWKKKIVLEWNIEEKIFVNIDPIALDRIINNLIENAIKYTNDNGKIIVYLKTFKNKVILEIKDTGIGISEEQIKNIFKPYHQISHQKRNIQGIGMGLNIIKKIMNEIKGDIEVESKLGFGSVFKLNFFKPDFQDEKTLIEDSGNLKIYNNFSRNIINNNRKNILIIEDNKDMLNYLNNSLLEDYNTFTAENGLEGLEILSKIPKPNLIISDIMMDVMDGYKFYENLQENLEYQAIPLIFLTAKTSLDEKLIGLKKGAVDFIYKPFSIDELKNKIVSILNIQEKQKKENYKELGVKFSKILYSGSNKDSDILFFNMLCSNYKIDLKEKEIIRLLLDGMEYKDISLKLDISVGIVRNRLHKIYKKFGVKNKVELVNIFIKKNKNKNLNF